MGMAAAQSGLPSDPENASKSLISVSSVRLSGTRRRVAAGGSRHQADAAAAVLRLQREVAAVELLGLRRAQPGDGTGRPLRRNVLGEIHLDHWVDAGGLDGTLPVGGDRAGAEAGGAGSLEHGRAW